MTNFYLGINSELLEKYPSKHEKENLPEVEHVEGFDISELDIELALLVGKISAMLGAGPKPGRKSVLYWGENEDHNVINIKFLDSKKDYVVKFFEYDSLDWLLKDKIKSIIKWIKSSDFSYEK